MTETILAGSRFLAAFDPGNGTGWAVFGYADDLDKGKVVPLGYGNVYSREALYALLKELGPVAQVVIEDFRLFQHKALAQSGSRLETVRVIGAIESWAALNNSSVTLQPSSILPIAAKWSGLVPQGSHSTNHHVSAYNHGWYYLQKRGIIKPVRQPA